MGHRAAENPSVAHPGNLHISQVNRPPGHFSFVIEPPHRLSNFNSLHISCSLPCSMPPIDAATASVRFKVPEPAPDLIGGSKFNFSEPTVHPGTLNTEL